MLRFVSRLWHRLEFGPRPKADPNDVALVRHAFPRFDADLCHRLTAEARLYIDNADYRKNRGTLDMDDLAPGIGLGAVRAIQENRP